MPKPFPLSLVATAPSPATSGTSLVVTAGHGARFPTPPFMASICPANTTPSLDNAERVLVTAVSTDTFTIVRAREGSTARTVVVGDFIFAGPGFWMEVETGLADQRACGIVRPGIAGAALAFGNLCYLQASDSRWELIDADAEATCGPLLLAMCVLAAAADGNVTLMLMMGSIRADSLFPTFTISAPVYASTTAGGVQVTQPSGADDCIRVVGHGVTADEMYFNPSPDWMLHT